MRFQKSSPLYFVGVIASAQSRRVPGVAKVSVPTQRRVIPEALDPIDRPHDADPTVPVGDHELFVPLEGSDDLRRSPAEIHGGYASTMTRGTKSPRPATSFGSTVLGIAGPGMAVPGGAVPGITIRVFAGLVVRILVIILWIKKCCCIHA
jgi:hypothetical protein